MAGLDPAIAHQQSGRDAMRGSSPRMTENINFSHYFGVKLPTILLFLNSGQSRHLSRHAEFIRHLSK